MGLYTSKGLNMPNKPLWLALGTALTANPYKDCDPYSYDAYYKGKGEVFRRV